jgi:hypothetical protein
VPLRSPEKHDLRGTQEVAGMTRLTVVATQGEADVICSLLRTLADVEDEHHATVVVVRLFHGR